MKFIIFSVLLLFLSCITCLSQSLKPEKIKAGDEIEQLTLASGKVYKDAKVIKITFKGLRIMWSGGVKTIPPKELPMYTGVFPEEKKVQPRPTVTPLKKTADKATPKSAKFSSQAPQNLEEVKQCIVFIENAGGGDASGFIMEVDGKQWLYTNVHAVDGAKGLSDLKILDMNGKRITSFGQFQCIESGDGVTEVSGELHSADAVRLELKKKRPIALRPSGGGLEFQKGSPVVTLGDNAGDKTLEVLHGIVLDRKNGKIVSSCQTAGGCSGGALISATSYKVFGIHTLGVSNTKVVPFGVGDKVTQIKTAKATIIKYVKWRTMKAESFFAISLGFKKFMGNLEILILYYELTPTSRGFTGFNKRLPNGQSISNYLVSMRHLKSARWLLNFKLKMEKNSKSNIKKSNVYIFRSYVSQLAGAQRDALSSVKYLKKQQLTLPTYYKYQYKYRYEDSLSLAGEVYKKVTKTKKWFSDRTKNGGKFPVGHWTATEPLGYTR